MRGSKQVHILCTRRPVLQFNGQRFGAGRALIERGRHGFSLIEMIAVVTILAILVTATLPAFIRKADDAADSTEISNLAALANGFQKGVAHARYIPSFTNWATFVATNVSWQVAAVQTNGRNNERVFLVDPAFTLGPASASNLPYMQGTNAYQLLNPRFMILSSISLPLPITSGPVLQSDFNVLWSYPDNGTPTWLQTWQGATNDLKVQRIDLTPSFSQLILSNLTTTAAPFVIDNAAFSMKPGTLANFVFTGTVLNLTNLSNAPQISEMINKQTAWAFNESVTESLTTNTGSGGGKGGGKGGGGGGTIITTNYVTNYFWIPQAQ